MPKPQLDGRQRVVIETVTPEIDGGRFAAKRTIGDTVRVEADIFTDGHDSVAAVVRLLAGRRWTSGKKAPCSFSITIAGPERFR